ncbi:MAG: type VI secretion system baseplate subunit TssF, partial [Telluria sp.]
SVKNLLLGCTPVVNLFNRRGVPVQLTHTSPDYAVLADATHASSFEVYSVNAVQLVRETAGGSVCTDFAPLYSVRHGAADSTGRSNYWLTRRDEDIAAISPGHEIRIALMDSELVTANNSTSTLCTELTCTNRDLPRHLVCDRPGGDLSSDDVPSDLPIRFLRKPSASYRFNAGSAGHWRLISHLSLNFSVLNEDGLADFKKMLALYDLPRTAASQRQIEGITALEHGTVRAWVATRPVRSLMPGIGIRMTVDEQAFVGSGLYVFTQVIDHYFGLSCQLNCFTQLEVVSQQSGEEIIKCPPRSAEIVRP